MLMFAGLQMSIESMMLLMQLLISALVWTLVIDGTPTL
jgi:hypothetical protein